MRFLKYAIGICGGLALMTCTVAAAPATAESQAQIAELVRLVDYGQDVGEVRFYELKTGDIITVPFDADGSAEYYINGNCDEDCSNLDLVVTPTAPRQSMPGST